MGVHSRKIWAGGLAAAAFLVAALGAGLQIRDLNARLDSEERRSSELARRLTVEEQTSAELEELLEERDAGLRAARSQRNRALAQAENAADRLEDEHCFDEPSIDGSGFARGPRRGDVDGDGIKEPVFVLGRPRLKGDGCRYVVVVKTTDDVYRRRAPIYNGDSLYARLYLTPGDFFEINGAPGDEFLVVSVIGATGTGFIGFTVADGQLSLLAGPDGKPVYLGAFSSSGHGDGVDCVAGMLVKSSYEAVGNSKDGYQYEVDRKFYSVSGAVLNPVHSEHHVVPYSRGLDRFPEFTGDAEPLPHCPQSS